MEISDDISIIYRAASQNITNLTFATTLDLTTTYQYQEINLPTNLAPVSIDETLFKRIRIKDHNTGGRANGDDCSELTLEKTWEIDIIPSETARARGLSIHWHNKHPDGLKYLINPP